MQRRKPNAPVKALTLDKRAIRSRRAYRSIQDSMLAEARRYKRAAKRWH